MSMMRMSVKQYDDLRAAQEAGDEVRAKAIVAMGYQKDYDPALVEANTTAILTETPEVPHEDILYGLDVGLSDTEIMSKFGVSAQTLAVIKSMKPKSGPRLEEDNAKDTQRTIYSMDPVEFDIDEVLNDVAAGMGNKEITEKYNISPQKLGAIKKGAK